MKTLKQFPLVLLILLGMVSCDNTKPKPSLIKNDSGANGFIIEFDTIRGNGLTLTGASGSLIDSTLIITSHLPVHPKIGQRASGYVWDGTAWWYFGKEHLIDPNYFPNDTTISYKEGQDIVLVRITKHRIHVHK